MIVQCHGSVGQISVHDPVRRGDARCFYPANRTNYLAAAAHIQTSSQMNATFWRRETGKKVTVVRPALPVIRHRRSRSSKRGLVVGRVQRWKGPQILCAALAD